MKEKWIFLTVFVSVLALLVVGCGGEVEEEVSTLAEPRERDLRPDVAGTVGQFARGVDGSYMPVLGCGLVINLGNKGASEVPPHLREYLIKDMVRQGIGLRSGDAGNLSPRDILADLDTAVVIVSALIPPRSLRGERFDVVVTAHSATGTQSLDGGILMPTELRLDIGTSSDPSAGSKVWAVAGGPVMLNPFAEQSDVLQLREGRIVGGGKVSRNRRISLMLIRPDHQMADMIQERINSRFPSDKKVATAKDGQVVEIVVPPAYRGDQMHFLDLVTHLPLNSSPEANEIRVRDLVAKMSEPDAPHEGIALVLEAQGGQVIPVIKQLYDSDVEAAAFLAARTGMRLGDNDAAEAVLAIAGKPGAFQVPAIEALGRHRGLPRADLTMQKLLDDENNMVRIAAYEALRRRGSRAIVQIDVDGLFSLEIVRSSKNMIYATRTVKPRIVIFGNDLQVKSPVFFNAPDDLVTINANEGSDELVLWRKIQVTGGVSDKFRISFDAVELVKTLGSPAEYGRDGEIAGLGLTYGQVVGVLYRLCEQQGVDAKFVLQGLPGDQEMLQRVEDFALEDDDAAEDEQEDGEAEDDDFHIGPYISGAGQ